MSKRRSAPPPLDGRGQGGGRTTVHRGSPRPPTPSPLGEGEREYAHSLVLYEDAHLIAFNKPVGLPVQGGSGVTRSLEDLLAAFAKSNGKRPRLVHRLDRETSGIIIAARTKPAAAFFSEAFAGREARKLYLAIVCGGAPEPREGEIALALKKAQRAGLDIMEIAHTGGQAALTRYKTLSATPQAALLKLAPETGRMHQLRAHLAAIGRPIAGDGKYGGLYRIGAVATPQLLLHAAALELPHPEKGRIRLEAPIPPAFQAAITQLSLESPPAPLTW